jgi:cytochrome b
MSAPVWHPVWDVPVRVLHWTLVASFVLCWASTVEPWSAIGPWHEPAGWLAFSAAAMRIVWGLVAPGERGRHARLAAFVRGPRAVLAYARRVRAGSAPRHVGHNPLGGWMAVALWASVGLLTLSGWLYTTDAFFGDATVEAVHEAFAWSMLALVALHVMGAIATGRRHGENLVAAMWHGRKCPADPGDVN